MLFRDITDFKKYVPVNVGFGLEVIAIYLSEIDRTILKRYLGTAFYNVIQAAFDASEGTPLATPTKELVELLREATANFAMGKWIVSGQVSFSQSGVHIVSNENMKTAFEWQINNIIDDSNERGYNALEDALAHLEDNIDNAAFAAYKASDEFKENNYLFVPSAKEFCKYFSSFEASRINFFMIRSVLRKVEDFEIKSVILPDYFADLKTTLTTGAAIGANAQAIIDLIKPAEVNLAVAKAIHSRSVTVGPKGMLVFDNTGGRQTVNSQKHAETKHLEVLAKAAERDGKNYLRALSNYLETNKDNYPLYTADPLYVAPTDRTGLNDTDKPFFVGM